MLNEKSVEKLINKYNVPEHELVEMGLIKPKVETLCTRTTKAEHEKIYIKSIESIKYSSMSDMIRDYMADLIRTNYIDAEEVNKLKKKKIRKGNEAHISVKVDKTVNDDFKNLCKKNHVKPATTLRLIVRAINKKERGKKY